jgi:hypothetical protein
MAKNGQKRPKNRKNGQKCSKNAIFLILRSEMPL